MLFRGGALFCGGRSRFLDNITGGVEGTAKVYVKIVPEALGEVLVAQLDTGAAWSVLDAEVADALSLLNGNGFPTPLTARGGVFHGRLERIRIDLVADEGESFGLDATVWVSPQWRQGNFLGYEGFLSRLRFAIDPSDNFFYFGTM